MTDPLVSKMQRRAALNREFTPAAPVSSRSAFAGRIEQIMQITGAVQQAGRHAILYGERGVGKTSLANILSELLVPIGEDVRDYAVRVNCTVDDKFGSIWQKVFEELGLEVPQDWKFGDPNPDDLRRRLSRVDPPMVIVLDEYDRVDDDTALSLMADTIKALSDHLVKSKLVLVGVSDSIEDLIGEHESVRRALEEVQMPRMREPEIRELVQRGFESAGMSITKPAEDRIVKLSEGLPTYAHLLSLKAGERAANDDRDKVNIEDIRRATQDVAESRHSTAADYHTAIQSARPEALYAQVLAACALADKDQLGYFTAKSVVGPMSAIMGKPFHIPAFSRHLSNFIEADRGQVLQRRGTPKKYRYRFRDPLMQPFAILAALANGVIPESYQAELFEAKESAWDVSRIAK